ncbi:MAG: hypothetical protein ACI97K_002715 [Glaciecola sp.]
MSGLTNGSADSLSEFDLDVAFDVSKLTFNSFSLTNLLGDIGPGGDAEDFSLGNYASGLIGISIVSYLLEAELDLLQSASFSLATFTFDVLSLEVGDRTEVSVDDVFSFADATDNANEFTFAQASGVGVIVNPSNVSAPATLVLFVISLLAIGRKKIAFI